MNMETLEYTLNRINWRYGKGDIRRVVVTSESSPGEPVQGYVCISHGGGMMDSTAEFSVLSSGSKGKRVRFRGRERLIQFRESNL